jgi:hypothetical protein
MQGPPGKVLAAHIFEGFPSLLLVVLLACRLLAVAKCAEGWKTSAVGVHFVCAR